MKRLISSVSFLLLCLVRLLAQSPQQEAMERIRSDSNYRWGEAHSTSQEEAREKAFEDLVAKLKTILVSESQLSNDDFANEITAVTVGSLEDVKEIFYRDDKGMWTCMKYVSEAAMRAADEERCEMIVEMVNLGQQQEGEVNISEALKYYTWALRLLNTFHDKVEVDTPKGRMDAKVWLTSHIPAIFDNIKFTIPQDGIYDNPADYDRYQITLKATYAGHPVSLLDVSYFNGESQVSPVHFKSGEGVLSYHDIGAINNIDLSVIYDYAKEGRNFSPFLAAAYPKRFQRMPFNDRADFRTPLDKSSIEKDKKSAAANCTVTESAPAPMAAAENEAIFKQPRNTITRDMVADSEKYLVLMKRVEDALRSRDYSSVRDCFTDEGFRIFEMMTGSGTISVTKARIDYTVEGSGLYLVGKSIPVNIKVGKHVSKENIVFRFDPVQEKIKSVAYALTERAENDIFRESGWAMDSRYALLQFMEDYQTAYSLKRLDYIESIFSDNAIIIVGSVSPSARKRFYGATEIPGKSFTDNVKYTKYNKDSYLQKLKEDFRKKSFIQLVFEDTYISKVGGAEDYADNEVMWIELKQNYYSSNYSDKGYLALQINLKPKGSMINVRTWTPHFVPMDELKRSFPVGFN